MNVGNKQLEILNRLATADENDGTIIRLSIERRSAHEKKHLP